MSDVLRDIEKETTSVHERALVKIRLLYESFDYINSHFSELNPEVYGVTIKK